MDCSTHGRSCCAHHACGSLLGEMLLFIFLNLQILVDDEEQSVLASYHVSYGIDRFCVGFLKSELLKFEGMLAQVIDVHPGRCVAVIISCLLEEMIKQMTGLV